MEHGLTRLQIETPESCSLIRSQPQPRRFLKLFSNPLHEFVENRVHSTSRQGKVNANQLLTRVCAG
jgi:hypothetical protein